MRAITRWARICLIAALILSTGASAFSIRQTPLGFTTRWSNPTIGFYVNPAGSDDISNGSDLAAVMQSFADWEAITCSKLAFNDLGDTFTSSVIANGASPNGQNEVIWIEDASWSFGKFVLGVTTPITYQSGDIVEADIAFNGYQQQWSTNGQWGSSDVKSVAIHEIGHAFGMQHNLQGNSLQEPPTMSPAADPYGKSATLETDDKLGACFLYPSGNKYECNGDAQCPYVVDNAQNGEEFYAAKLICNINQCAYTDGSGTQKGIGEACTTQNDCTPPLFCQPLSTGEAYCSQYCIPEASTCPNGFECYPYADGDGGACLVAPEEVKGEGVTCVGNEECASNVCYPNAFGTWECRNPCGANEACPAGYTCFYSPGFATDACLPDALVPATKVQDGYPCNAAADCASGICVANPGTIGPQFCRSACIPGQNSCSVGWDCLDLGGGNGACVPGAPPTLEPEGGACETAGDCETGTCFGGVCAKGCNVISAGCSDGQRCLRLGSDDVGGVCQSIGPAGLGSLCQSDLDCASLFCASFAAGGATECVEPCVLDGGNCDNGTCAALFGQSLVGGCFGGPNATTDGADGSDGTTGQTDIDNTTGTDDNQADPYIAGSGNSSGCQQLHHSSQSSWPFAYLLLLLVLACQRLRDSRL